MMFRRKKLIQVIDRRKEFISQERFSLLPFLSFDKIEANDRGAIATQACEEMHSSWCCKRSGSVN